LLIALGVALAGPVAAQTVPTSREQISLTFAPLVKQVAPAVVNIYARQVVQAREVSPLFNDPFFQQFFGQGGFGFGQPVERVQSSLGSGVIVGADGLIVTNYHVIRNAKQITVALGDGREFPAKIVESEQRIDLALLRIDVKGKTLPTLEIGKSDDLEVGDLVLAIGNPFGVGQTVTSGIVSGVARTRVGTVRTAVGAGIVWLSEVELAEPEDAVARRAEESRRSCEEEPSRVSRAQHHDEPSLVRRGVPPHSALSRISASTPIFCVSSRSHGGCPGTTGPLLTSRALHRRLTRSRSAPRATTAVLKVGCSTTRVLFSTRPHRVCRSASCLLSLSLRKSATSDASALVTFRNPKPASRTTQRKAASLGRRGPKDWASGWGDDSRLLHAV